jgi:hypothetical protein
MPIHAKEHKVQEFFVVSESGPSGAKEGSTQKFALKRSSA